MNTSDVPLIPASGRVLEGILKRQRIRELIEQGMPKNQIGGVLNIGSTALNKHYRIIKAEDEQAKRQKKVSA